MNRTIRDLQAYEQCFQVLPFIILEVTTLVHNLIRLTYIRINDIDSAYYNNLIIVSMHFKINQNIKWMKLINQAWSFKTRSIKSFKHAQFLVQIHQLTCTYKKHYPMTLFIASSAIFVIWSCYRFFSL